MLCTTDSLLQSGISFMLLNAQKIHYHSPLSYSCSLLLKEDDLWQWHGHATVLQKARDSHCDGQQMHKIEIFYYQQK